METKERKMGFGRGVLFWLLGITSRPTAAAANGTVSDNVAHQTAERANEIREQSQRSAVLISRP
jgi:hypothetical protein